jgi:glycosyltransferase involved in cell wall biosynthesis
MHLLVLNYEFPPLGAGAGNATQALAREWVRAGHQVTVITTWFTGLPDTEEVDGYTVHRVRSRRVAKDRSNPLEMLHYTLLAHRRAREVVRAHRPDHVVAFFALPTGYIAWRLYAAFGIPYTLSLRGGDVPGFLPKDLWVHHLITRPLNWPVWGHAAQIVANSEGLRDLAQKTAGKYGKRVLYIPNGVDTQVYYPRSRTEETGQISLLFVGRLVRQKGVTYIIRALAEMCAHDSPLRTRVHLTIVGDGPLRTTLMQEASVLGIADMITWKGWLSREALPIEYRTHDVFVFPSFEEGMPNVVLEAIASGLAVVATDIPGTNTIIESEVQGILIREHEALTSALLRVCTDQALRTRYQHQARQRAKEFGWDVVAQSYLSLFST